MSGTAALKAEAGAVSAGLHYTIDTGVKPVNETFGPNNIRRRVSGEHEVRQMTIRNGRPLADEFDLEVTGFEFVKHETRVRDFFDAEELKRVYYPEVEALVKKVSGASRVVVFDHTLRSGDEAEREARLVREPVLNVHNDYTEWSGPQRVRELLPDDAENLLRRRIANNPEHRWFYFPLMRRDEALVFKVYESAKDGRARFTAHSSFEDPNTPEGAPPRQSIEARTLAFFE